MATSLKALSRVVLLACLSCTALSLRADTTNLQRQIELVQSQSNATSKGTPVYANVYDLDDSNVIAVVNTLLFAGGAYHVAIEAFGNEVMYGGAESEETGIGFMRHPRQHPVHKYYKSILLGETRMTYEQFIRTINNFKRQPEWRANQYDLLTHNCVSFSMAVAQAFPEKFTLPSWLSNLMNVGAAVLPAVLPALGSLAKVSTSISEASTAAYKKVTAFAACSEQFNGMCGDLHVDGKYFSVSCPDGMCCHKYKQFSEARCVPFCPGPKDASFSNNANGACR